MNILKTKKNILLTTMIISSLSFSSMGFAETEKEIDPSDLTKANTSAYLGVNNQGDVKLSGSISFGFENGQVGMTTLEGTMDQDGKYKDSRLQYFQVFNLDNATTPRVAASLDLIDNKSFTTAALGGIALFKTPIESLTFFGRGAILAGEYDDDFTHSMGEDDNSIVGGMAAAYAVWKPGADGSYFAFFPEYTYLDGDITTSSIKTTLMAATPLSSDGKKWGQFKIENSQSTIESSNFKEKTDDTVAWLLYKAYF